MRKIALTILMAFLFSSIGYGQSSADNKNSPFKVELSFGNTTSPAEVGEYFTVSTKITNMSNEKQKITTLGGCNWTTDNTQIDFAEVYESNWVHTRILNPKEKYMEDHFLKIKDYRITKKSLTFRLGFKNYEGEDVPFNAKKDDGKVSKYTERTWSNPLTIIIK